MLLNSSVQFSSRWHLCARECPYALRPILQECIQRRPWDGTDACLVEDGPVPASHCQPSPTTFLYTSFLQAVYTTLLLNNSGINYLLARRIRDCLHSYGFHDVWIEGKVGNEIAFLLTFKKKLIDHFKQEWETKYSRAIAFKHLKLSTSQKTT